MHMIKMYCTYVICDPNTTYFTIYKDSLQKLNFMKNLKRRKIAKRESNMKLMRLKTSLGGGDAEDVHLPEGSILRV